MLDSILIKKVQIVTPEGIRDGDAWVKNGKIEEIDWNLNRPAQLVINEPGLALIPGVIDAHVHFREPGLTHKETIETGSKAAAAGGVTSFFEMPNTNPATTTCERLEEKKTIASQKSLINYNFFIGATPENLDELIKAENIPGIKVFMGCSTGQMLVNKSEDLEKIFANSDKLIAVHAEDEEILKRNEQLFSGSTDVKTHLKIRSAEAAITATKKAVELSQKYQKRLHICHMSTADEALFLKTEKIRAPITCEVTPQHLLLDESFYEKLGTLIQMNPPIREKKHPDILWKALKAGLIDCIATDHAPHTYGEKTKPYGIAPSGMPGVQTSLPLMLNLVNQGRCRLEEVVRWMCENPAKIFNVSKKGKIESGFGADLVLIDLKAKKKITHSMMISKCRWTPYDGWTTQGWPLITIVNGQIVYREGDFVSNEKGKEISINLYT